MFYGSYELLQTNANCGGVLGSAKTLPDMRTPLPSLLLSYWELMVSASLIVCSSDNKVGKERRSIR